MKNRQIFHTPRRKTSRLGGPLLPLISTLALYLLLAVIIGGMVLDLWYEPKAIAYDLALQTLVAYLLYALIRKPWVFLLMQTLVMMLVFIGHAGKSAFHGVPVTPDDVFSVPNLVWLLPFHQQILVLLVVAALALLAVTSLRWKALIPALALTVLVGWTLPEPGSRSLISWLDATFGNSVWNQRGNLVYRGASLHSIIETARYQADARSAPDAAAVENALAQLQRPAAVSGLRVSSRPPRRNLHLILLESFWDPSELIGAGLDSDPLDPAFRALWNASGNSMGLSPVFGGYTANTEFEVLGGFPVTEDSVKFERRLRNEAPCLPRVLREMGYVTLASHPNVAGFWNRVNAYDRLGFEHYWSEEHFIKDDMNRNFLSDSSLYRQIEERRAALPKDDSPLFNYVVTYFGHVNYPLNERRPAVIKASSKVPDVEAYANTVLYKTREVMDYLAVLQRDDPNAVIVLFGDHPPFLGPNFAGYEESGLTTSSKSTFTPEMFYLAHSAPLIVIDGQRGPLKLGKLPHYRLPALLAGLLGLEDEGILALAAQPAGLTVRPLPGVQLVLDEQGDAVLCSAQSASASDPSCAAVSRWLQQLQVLDDDLFMGEQYSLRHLSFPQQAQTLTVLQSAAN